MPEHKLDVAERGGGYLLWDLGTRRRGSEGVVQCLPTDVLSRHWKLEILLPV